MRGANNPVVNTYGPTFYRQMNLGAMASTYSALAQMCGIIATIINISITDKVGRRPPVIVGAAGCVLFNALIAGLASKRQPGQGDINMVIASVMLVLASSKMFQCQACEWTHPQQIGRERRADLCADAVVVMAAEIGGPTMRKKCESRQHLQSLLCPTRGST
jgi:MFS family permease